MDTKISIYKLKNKKGINSTLTNFGARIMNIYVPDKDGKPVNIVLGYDRLPDTINGDLYLGATIGRYANRIANGMFTLDGENYILKKNGDGNALHGGEIGYNAMVWQAEQKNNKLTFSLLDKDGREGYPGNVFVRVNYELTENNEFHITYEASTDKATPVNLTNHAYFNLNGADTGSSVHNHLVKINANYYTPVNANMIPTGEIASVEGTPFDFRNFKKIGLDINAKNTQLKIANGYDHNFVINGKENELNFAAEAISDKTGISLKVYTTEPGMQLYTANFLNINEFGKQYKARTAFCLETQHYPDSPNKEHFPNTILYPGKKFKSQTIYKFDILSD